jgi:1-acyl-sn-glycerol-3-phosphate acyltransferase
MSFDAFEPELARAFKGYDDAAADRFFRLVERAGERLGVEFSGLEHVPDGAAILVMNHAFGWDAMLPMAALRRFHRRRVWVLGEHLWWKLPFLRTLAARVGTVDGTPQNVDELLAAGELVLLLPGGLREALKPSELRYRLLWGTRYGFVRAAIRHKAPLVPVAGIGADEVFELAGDAFARGRKWLRRDFPLPRPAWGLPIVHRRALRYMLGEPVQPTLVPGEDEEKAVRRIRREVRGAIEEMLDEELARRLGVHP